MTLALAASVFVPACWADRPFLATTSAAAEEDDDRVWSVAAWALRDRGLRQQGLSAEYAFEPRLSSEFTLTRSRALGDNGSGKDDGNALEAEAELKWLYNNIARDGWGVGVAMALGASKAGDAGWRGGNWQLTLPLSWQFHPEGGFLHLNLGWSKERGTARERFTAAGLELPLARHWQVFAEVSKAGEQRLAHAGIRHWLKREKLALDFSGFRRRVEGVGQGTGWVLAVAFYDL